VRPRKQLLCVTVSPTRPARDDESSERETALLGWGVPLLRPKEQRPALRGRLRRHTVVRCPLNGHQVGVCRGLCTPSPEGEGLCGRLAPHALIGRTQAAIAAHVAHNTTPSRFREGLPRRPPRTLIRTGDTQRGP
jgi:hypothetical protein